MRKTVKIEIRVLDFMLCEFLCKASNNGAIKPEILSDFYLTNSDIAECQLFIRSSYESPRLHIISTSALASAALVRLTRV